MSKYWGVLCGTCGEFINLGNQNEDDPVTTYIPSDVGEPVPHNCGSAHLYVSADVVDEEGAALNCWPESI